MTIWQFKPAPRRPGTQLTWFQSWMFLKSREFRNTVAVAARRSGKTVGKRARIIDACLDPAAGDVGYMAPTLGQAKRLMWRPLMRDLRDPAAKHFIEGRPNHSELSVEFKSGVRLYLYSAEAYERVRGDGFKLFVTDESDDPLFTDEVFDEAIMPALSDNLGHLIQGGTPKGRGRLFREYRKGLPGEHFDPEYATIQVPAWEAGIISREEIERARRTRPRRAFEQEYGATFNAPIGLIYEEWNEERHVVGPDALPRLHEFDEVIVGVDFGTAARGAMLPIGIDRVRVPAVDDVDEGELTRAWIVEEHSESGLAYADRSGDRKGWWGIARDIQRSWHPTTWYYDPAGGSGEETEARAAGLGRQLAEVVHSVDPRAKVLPADNRVGPGIAAVQQHLHYDDMLGEPPRLRVLSSCKWTIKEFGSYRWSGVRGTDDEFEDRPVKSMDHCFVAGTMVTTDGGDVPIEEIQAGMRVLTRQGFYPVKAAGITQVNAEVWTLATSDGRELRGTPNHLVWTAENGWSRLDSLRYEDTLSVWENTDQAKVSSSGGGAIVDTQSLRAANCESTSTTRGGADVCIRTFGNTTTAPFQTDTTSTTRTKTPSTTTSPILSVCLPPRTFQCTAPRRNISTENERGSTRFDLSPPSGTEAQRGSNGTGNMDAKLGANASRSGASVTSAGASSNRSHFARTTDSVAMPASPPGAARPVLTMRREFASDAESGSRSTSTRVRGIAVAHVRASHAAAKGAPVYDLTVDGPPEFFANGILVHNCMDAARYGIHTHLYSPRISTRRRETSWEDRPA